MANLSSDSSASFHGFDTTGVAVLDATTSGSSGNETAVEARPRKRRSARKLVRQRAASLQQRDERGRFVAAKRGLRTDVSDEEYLTGNDEDSTGAESLAWDGHQQPLLNTTVRRWSVDTQSSVPAIDGDLVDERLFVPALPAHPEGRESALSGELDQTLADMAAEIRAHRDALERALMEIEDDLRPSRGRKLPRAFLEQLSAAATRLKRTLQESHMFLVAHDQAEYDANYRDDVVANRRLLGEFVIEMQEQLALLEAEAAEAARANQAGEAAAREKLEAKRELATARVKRVTANIGALEADADEFCKLSSTSDEQLYERAEQHKLLCGRLESAVRECDKIAEHALDAGMVKDSGDMDAAVAMLQQLKIKVEKHMMATRRDAGVWAEKGRRAAARGDMKMPGFTGNHSDKLTIYEFEREWVVYKAALNYSVEEALKELKVAIGQPARAAIQKMTDEKAVFAYLKTHYGNPVILLNTKEEEIKAWSNCSGTATQQREWLITAKDRLEAIVALCEEHKMMTRLHYSGVAKLIQSKLAPQMIEQFTDILEDNASEAGVVDEEIVIGLLIPFLGKKIKRCTLGVNLDAGGIVPGDLTATARRDLGGQNSSSQINNGGHNNNSGSRNQRQNQGRYGQHNQNQASAGSGPRGSGQQGKWASRQNQGGDPHKCEICNGDHPALFYCEQYIKANLNDRFEMIKRQRTCGRCLTMSRKFEGPKSDWWPAHERFCKNQFACKEGLCKTKMKNRQLHITVCFTHATENKKLEQDFVKSLDAARLPAGVAAGNLRFLHMLAQASYRSAAPQATARDSDGFEILPDIEESGLFLMQMLPAELDPSKELLCFYDSGCASAGLSERAFQLMRTTTVRDGPTVLEVAGARSILLPHGEEQFCLELDENKKKAAITGLRMPNITADFPLVNIMQAWQEIQQAVGNNGQLRGIAADPVVGGRPVDVILGIKYLKYFPQLVFSLPSGLAVFKAKFKSASGCQAVLGGPHAAWSHAADQSQLMNPRVYLTSEARAWYAQDKWVRINADKFRTVVEDSDSNDELVTCRPLMERVAAQPGCSHCHCEEPVATESLYNVAAMERRLWQVEELGTESPYRCVSCRNCNRCKKGDTIEAISLQEEAEQFLIEKSISLDIENNIVWAHLPFIKDPVVELRPNKFVAEKVLSSQMRLFERFPSMREDAVKSHAKLLDRGHVKLWSEVVAKFGERLNKLPGQGYFIPWRTVYKEGSLSTPCRVVYDASSKTPHGESLNGILAKGQNRLIKLQHLMIRLRLGAEAVTADITMAYNGMKLQPEHLKFQKYLWKEGLDPSNATVEMVVTTLIYGVKPSGQQCQVSIERLADYFLESGKCALGAAALKNDTYVDDIISGQSTAADCVKAAEEIKLVLGKGSMAVKAFTYSGRRPDDLVSADGVHVGMAGYLWAPEEDVIKLDVGPPRLGRSKRGRRPEAIVGDFKQALSSCFTKRTLTGLVAGVFDPLGLATPVMAGLKLDLHQLCALQLDWDDPVPAELLDKWAGNMAKIQQLRDLSFRRSVVPEHAAADALELLVATDASQHIGVVAVYARVPQQSGGFSCQLLVAKSKLLTGLTIPKAELRSAVAAAVLANVVKSNLGDKLLRATYVTDSTVCLYWITQDDRPLQLGVRNAVSEIRRLSDPADWHHVDTELNVADLGTRPASVEALAAGSTWQDGQPWMKLPREKMPIKTAAQVTMTAEEKRAAAAEMRAADVRGSMINLNSTAVTSRYTYSNYLVDPCRFSWSKVVRIVAIVQKFIWLCRRRSRDQAASIVGESAASGNNSGGVPEGVPTTSRLVTLSVAETEAAEMYFFRKATAEIKQFCKPKEYANCSREQDGVLYYSGRLLDTGGVRALESVMFDLNPVTFCRPLVDRNSPIAYSIMLEVHWASVSHLNATTTYRESLEKVFILKGRELAQEVRANCVFCKRYKARLLEVEMGKIHDTRLAIAPPFAYCQVDLLGPLQAACEHNHRSTVKVWGAVFKDPASGAVFVHAMSKCDTSAFVQAYTRFAARFCHPLKLFPDEGSQLLKACGDMQISWLDVGHTLNSKYQVGVEFSACPVGGHNFHGQVERSIREVKKLFQTVYRGVKLDILGYETAFAWVSNELNNLPLCLGSRYRDLDNLDLITPNRLIHGRSNKRAMSGPCTIERPSKMLEKMDDVFEAWWKAWYDEKITDFVAKPPKWFRSDPPLRPGDIVVFQKRGADQVLGSPVWSVGRIVDTTESDSDGQVREVQIEYKNASENTFRYTHRAARSVAVLFSEEDLDLIQGLNEAARAAEVAATAGELYVDQQAAVVRDISRCSLCIQPTLCGRHSLYFYQRPFFYPVED